MRMKKTIVFPFVLFMMLYSVQAQETTTIEEITSNPGRYHHQSVRFEGYVQRYVASSAATTSFYIIQGEYGASLRVNTSDGSPRIFARYRVQGTIVIEDRTPLVIEISRTRLEEGGLSLTVTSVPQAGGSILPSDRLNLEEGQPVQLRANPAQNYRFEKWIHNGMEIGYNEMLEFTMPGDNAFLEAHFKREFPVMWVAIGGLVVVAIVLVVLLLRPKSKPDQPAFDDYGPDPGAHQFSPDPSSGDTMQVNPGQDYDTIRFEPDVPPTMQFIPGKLEILNGPDKGKTFMLAGYPTPDGSISSIGRDHSGWEDQSALSGGRKYAHVRIKDDSRTLSRMQAEMIYRNGKLYLKNLSSVNPSQVDGADVAINDIAEVKSGSKIKAGFIEFRYQE